MHLEPLIEIEVEIAAVAYDLLLKDDLFHSRRHSQLV